jgi:hypothetical protein
LFHHLAHCQLEPMEMVSIRLDEHHDPQWHAALDERRDGTLVQLSRASTDAECGNGFAEWIEPRHEGSPELVHVPVVLIAPPWLPLSGTESTE